MRKTTSLKIDEEIWKKVKIHAIEKDMEISEFIESVVKEKLKISDKGGRK